MIGKCKLVSRKLAKARMVQLATDMKRKITAMVENCCLEMDGFHTKVDLDIIPIGSCHRPYAHLGLNAEEISNPLGAPLGAILSRELSL